MGPRNDPRSTVADLEIYLFGITFPIACVLCIAILVQRIRRRVRGGRFTPTAAPKRQMHPNPPNYGGKERADLAVVGRGPSTDAHPPSSPRDGLPSLPSACDILQPLSQLTPLPSSGYLAAVLGRERRARATTTTTTTAAAAGAAAAPACLAATGDVLGSVDPPPHANGVPGRGEGRGGGGARSIELAWSDRTLRPSGSSDESCAALDDPQSSAFSPTGWRPDDLPELAGGVSGAGEPQPVQKRSQTVQNLYGVDEEGARAWRRVMMEYS
ncbi:hypothetical protein HFD88_006422 [Aspergillus terreus]|nr:hypothetical protein HFD88_006422 [Aspergillus terreus]